MIIGSSGQMPQLVPHTGMANLGQGLARGLRDLLMLREQRRREDRQDQRDREERERRQREIWNQRGWQQQVAQDAAQRQQDYRQAGWDREDALRDRQTDDVLAALGIVEPEPPGAEAPQEDSDLWNKAKAAYDSDRAGVRGMLAAGVNPLAPGKGRYSDPFEFGGGTYQRSPDGKLVKVDTGSGSDAETWGEAQKDPVSGKSYQTSSRGQIREVKGFGVEPGSDDDSTLSERQFAARYRTLKGTFSDLFEPDADGGIPMDALSGKSLKWRRHAAKIMGNEKGWTVDMIEKNMSEGEKNLLNKISTIAQIQTFLLSGATAREDEIMRIMNLLPRPGDSLKTQQDRLKQYYDNWILPYSEAAQEDAPSIPGYEKFMSRGVLEQEDRRKMDASPELQARAVAALKSMSPDNPRYAELYSKFGYLLDGAEDAGQDILEVVLQ